MVSLFLMMGMVLSGGAFFGGIYYSSCVTEETGYNLTLIRPLVA